MEEFILDAGVLELHVFQHDPAYEPMRLTAGSRIDPWLTHESPRDHSCGVSLIIPTFYNEAQKAGALDYLLEGIEQSQCVKELVLVAADGNEEILKPIREAHPHLSVTIATCAPNRRAQTRNIGVQAATQDMLLFLDDDMLMQDWRLADCILSHLLEEQYDCALFPRRNFAKFPLLYEKERLESVIQSFRDGKADTLGEEEFLDPVKDGSPFKTMAFCFPGCFMMISKEGYDRIGGFPEEFEGWGFEDTDFAMRAVRDLNVLNLFRATPPLLHIDHPVSPYKSDEYRKNLRQFSSSYDTLDMDWLCRKVFVGDHFGPKFGTASLSKEEYYEPIHSILEQLDVPFSEKAVLRNYEHVMEIRMKRGLNPIPSYATLHGSRGTQDHSPESDYDLLLLYRGGAYAEYFSTTQDGKVLEIESAGMSKFESLAAAPAIHPMRSPFELGKLAQSRVLWGDSSAFELWREKVLTVGLQVGLPVWLLSGIGLRLQEHKHGPYVDLYFSAIRKVLESKPADFALTQQALETSVASTVQEELKPTGVPLDSATTSRPTFDTNLFQPERFEELVTATRQLMDSELAEWRDDMEDHKRVFAVQVPEIWSALHLLLETE